MLIVPIALITLNLAPTPAKKPQSVDATIARAQAAWSRVKTLRATFEQTITNPITGSALTSKGELQQKKPNRLAINFTDPAGDRIVADGKYVWIFLQSATPGQVIRMSNTNVGAASTDLIGQFLNTPRRKYDATDAGTDRVGGRATRALILTAKPGQQLPFVRAKVWVDSVDYLIRQFESTDDAGVTRRVRLLTLTPNATVANSAFAFSVPKGVRVVER
jgi:outer membrane lipoprotein carrier protein